MQASKTASKPAAPTKKLEIQLPEEACNIFGIFAKATGNDPGEFLKKVLISSINDQLDKTQETK